MNKSELISAMAAEAQMSKADAKKALDAFISSVTNAMKAGAAPKVPPFQVRCIGM